MSFTWRHHTRIRMKYRRFFIVMVIISLIGSVASLVSPILISVWGKSENGLGLAKVVLLVGIMLFVWILQMVFVYIRERFAVHFNKKSLEDGLELFYHAEYEYLNREGPSNLLERIVQSVNATYKFMTGDAIQIWSSLFVVCVVLLLVALENVWICLILFAIIPINYFGYKLLNKILVKKSSIMQSKVAGGFQEMLSVVTQTDYLKQLGEYREVRKFMEKPAYSIYKAMADVNVIAQTASTAISRFNDIVKTVVMLMTVYIYLEEQANPYVIVLFSVLLPLFFSNVSFITNANLGKREMTAAQDFMRTFRENRESDVGIELGEIQSIRYEMEEVSAGNVKLNSSLVGTFHKGDVVWLRGESGSGKSTIVKHLLKFYKTRNLYLNDIRIYDISNQSLRNRVMYCSQQIPIVKGTLRDNLFFGYVYEQEKEERMCSTNIGAQLLLNKELSSIIEENGTNLSGGEKQKIAALRNAFQEADVVVLDEVTSNLDPDGAKEVYELFLMNREDRITFIISHDDMPEKYANKVINICGK